MKKICLIFPLVFVFFPGGNITAQPPVYGLTVEYELSINPDTLSYIMLFDVNGDSINEMIFTKGRFLHIYDLVSGVPAMDSIEFENEYVYTVHYSTDDSTTFLYGAEHVGGNGDTIEIKIVRISFDNIGTRDSFYVYAGWEPSSSCGEIITRLSSIAIFDIGTDSSLEIVINWGIFRYCGSEYQDTFGFMMACDFNGNVVVSPKEILNSLECDKFLYGARWYFVVLQNNTVRYWIPGEEYHYGAHTRVSIYDDMLREINFELLYYNWNDFKLLTTEQGYFLYMLTVRHRWVRQYFAPFFFEEINHYMPANALACYFKYNDMQYILTGTQNSYFELRDMDLNLLAFIWGPQIEISDVDAVDVDLDGTDELLCKTDSGFVLYRLNATTEIAGGEITLPSEFSIFAYPNPFNSQVNLSVSGLENKTADIHIYDIGGRLVRSYPSISGEIRWDGRDYTGSALSSGIYFVAARSSEDFSSTKVLLLR